MAAEKVLEASWNFIYSDISDKVRTRGFLYYKYMTILFHILSAYLTSQTLPLCILSNGSKRKQTDKRLVIKNDFGVAGGTINT